MDGIIVIGLVVFAAAAVALAVWWDRRQRELERCDRLIVDGRADEAPRRVASLESPRRRQQLAADLRWHLAAAARDRSSLGRGEREALVEHAETVGALADAIELHEVDPAALVLLQWVVAGPPPAEARSDAEAGEVLAHRIETAAAALEGSRLLGVEHVARSVARDGGQRRRRLHHGHAAGQ